MNQNDLRVIKTKENLYKALIELLEEKPLEKISISELCRRSNITRRTFYLHYENVPKYFEEIIEQSLNELEDSMKKTKSYRMSVDQELEPKMVHLFEHVYESKELYKFIFSSNSSFSYYAMFLLRIKNLIKSSMEIVKLPKDEVDFVITYQANAILGLILEWYFEDFQKTVEEMNVILVKVLKQKMISQDMTEL